MKRPIAVGAALLLSGCGVTESASVCTGMYSAEDRATSERQATAADTDPSTRVFAAGITAESCVTIWARRWATTQDDARAVAEAVATQCQGDILRVSSSQYRADQTAGNTSPLYDQWTGRETNYTDWAISKYERMALTRVIEARAGNCRAPA